MTIQVDEIGFDFDGVIADTAKTFIEIACQQYGYCDFSIDDITNFELENCIDIPAQTVEDIFTNILYDSVGNNLQPIRGAVTTLTKFSQTGSITIITARSVKAPVMDWLDLHFPEDVTQKITVVTTGDHNDKVRHIHQNNITYFIDDRAATCTQLAKEGIIPIVYEQPWNRNRHNLLSIASWDEIKQLVVEPGRNEK